MPELPDLEVLARSMAPALRGRVIAGLDVHQPKCLNLPAAEMAARLRGCRVEGVGRRGKWVLLALDDGGTLALNLGMGGETRLHPPEAAPDPSRERVVVRFADGWQLWVHHWWFGHVHYVPPGGLDAHPQIGTLGVEPLSGAFSVEWLAAALAGRRGRIKSYLLDQRVIAGIGNVYVQDALWRARLHPARRANTLTAGEVRALHAGIQATLREGIAAGGGPREQDVHGRPGRYMERIQVGYRTGEPCPRCGAIIEEVRVGQTTSYICPACQPPPAGGDRAGGR